jgi:hypothetical protein
MIAMKALGFAALALSISCSIGRASPLAASAQTEVVRFAAATVTDDQGARAVVSNVSASASDSNAACHVQVTFYGSDGSVINKEERRLKAGASAAIVAKAARALLRATVSIEADGDAAKHCDLMARLEISDLHTGTTFISMAPNPITSPVELDVTSSISEHSISKHKVLNGRHRFRRTPRLLANQAPPGVREEGQ